MQKVIDGTDPQKDPPKIVDLPTEPGKRMYRFIRPVDPAKQGPDDEYESVFLVESELTFEHHKLLLSELVSQFMYQPDEVQDMFLNWVDAMIAQGKAMHDAIEQPKSSSLIIIPGQA